MIGNRTINDRLLGCYLQRPELTLDSKYPLDKDEWTILFQKILYATIYNLALNGCKSVSIIDIDEFVRPFVSEYNVLEDNNFEDYITTVIELTDVDNFEYYYTEFRKFSCLNAYKEKGFDIKKFYDEDKSEESQLENLNQYSIDDIINYYEGLQVGIKRQYSQRDRDIEENQAGEGLMDFKERLKEEPLYGSPFTSEYLNTIVRGIVDGQLICISSPSGTGKTTVSCSTITNLCATKIWDFDKNCYIINPNKTKNGGLYIQFELDNISELSIKFLSYISGISGNIILDGKYTKEQEERIDEAIKILDESNIQMCYMPSFTKKSIEDCIKDNVIKYGIEVVVFDYIQESPSLSAELNSANGGIGMRNDQVLGALSDFLKLMARTYNVPVYTCTQTNANLGTNEIIGSESIAGSRSISHKLDVGGVLLPLRPKEKKVAEKIALETHEKGFGLPNPTHIYHLYKCRFSAYPQNIKVWVSIDMGTGRMKDCFCTSWDNMLIKVPKTKLERK